MLVNRKDGKGLVFQLMTLGAMALALSSCFGAANLIALALGITNASPITVKWNSQMTITPTGGDGVYTFALVSGPGSISTSGVFTAGGSNGTTTISVTDGAGSMITADIHTYRNLEFWPDGFPAGSTNNLNYLGGYGTVSFTITSGNGSISGSQFTAPTKNQYTTIKASDQAGNEVSAAIWSLSASNLKMWLKASTLYYADQAHLSTVSQVNDISGNGKHATQPTASAQPTFYRDIGVSGFTGAIVSDSTTDIMSIPELGSYTSATLSVYGYAGCGAGIICVFLLDYGANFTEMFALGTNFYAAGSNIVGMSADAQGDWVFAAATETAEVYGTYQYTLNGATMTGVTYKNGTQVATNTNAAFAATDYNNGAGPGAVIISMQDPTKFGALCEMIHRGEVSSAADLAADHAYLEAKCGVLN